MKRLILLMNVLVLMGCQSEVDKCVEAQMNVYKKTPLFLNPQGALTEEQAVAKARIDCLKAQAGK
jgi:hypothetical protein